MEPDALQQLVELKGTYDDEFNRTQGWDQRARSQAIKIVVRNHFGEQDLDITTTDAFLMALIDLVGERRQMNRVRDLARA